MSTKRIIRHATWLELFYDLIFVIVISNITHALLKIGHQEDGIHYFLKYVLMFLPVWWAWIGHTLHNNRFDVGDKWQNAITYLQLFGIIILSLFVAPDFEKHYLGFTLSYVFIRYLLVFLYWRSYHIHEEQREASRYLAFGFAIGASISLSSILFDGYVKFILLYAGILFDFLIPILGKKKIKLAEINPHHLPERLGLMTIILMGESIISITNNLESLIYNLEGRIIIFLGYALILSIFYLYFSFLENDVHGKVTRHGQILIYGHLPLYLSLGMIATLIHFSAPGSEINEFNFKLLSILATTILISSLHIIRLCYSQKSMLKSHLTLIGLIITILITHSFINSKVTILIVNIIILLGLGLSNDKTRQNADLNITT